MLSSVQKIEEGKGLLIFFCWSVDIDFTCMQISPGKRKKKLQRWRRKAGEMARETGRKSHFCSFCLFCVFELWLPYLCIYVNCKSFWPALYGRWWICCIQEIKDPVVTRMRSPNRTALEMTTKDCFCLICILAHPWVLEMRDEHREHKARLVLSSVGILGTGKTQRHRNVKQRERRLSGHFWNTCEMCGHNRCEGLGRELKVMGDFGCKLGVHCVVFHEAVNTWQDMFPGQT